jgi:hypothetical protein
MSANEQLRTLLQAERAVLPPKTAANLGWNRLAADLAANVAPLPVATGPLKLALWFVPKWLLAGFAVGLVGAGTVGPLLAPSAALGEAKHAVARQLPSARPRPVTLGAAPTVEPEPSAPQATPHPTPSLVPALAPSEAPGSAAATRTTFDAELGLISLAKARLDANDLSSARTLLARHAERFPNGVFAIERDALFALADCQEQPKNDGSFRRFAARHPSSPLLSRLERACQSASASAMNAAPPSSTASFANLPNGSASTGERINEPRQREPK